MNDQKLMVMRTIWAALLTGTVMFLVVGYVVTSGRQEALVPEPFLLPVLGFTALGLAAGSVLLPPVLLRQAFLALRLPTTEAPNPGPSSTRRRAKRFVDSGSVRSRLLLAAQPSFIVGMAMAEAVALHGFVLWFLGFELPLVIPFFAVCWGLMLSKFPRLSHFERALESAYDADLG